MTEDEIVTQWHQQVNGYEFEQALGDGEGQGSLKRGHSLRGCKESDRTEGLKTKVDTTLNSVLQTRKLRLRKPKGMASAIQE